MARSGKWARTVVVCGPPEALRDDQVQVIGTLRKFFYRQAGYIGRTFLSTGTTEPFAPPASGNPGLT